jgi:hypothetical protein
MRGWWALSTALVAAFLFVGARPAAAGDCRIFAATTSGSVDLSNASELHLRQADDVWIGAATSTPQTRLQISTVIFGVSAPVWSSAVDSQTTFDSGAMHVGDYSVFARSGTVVVLTDSCDAKLAVAVDDQNALLTVAGGTGVVLGALALLCLLLLAIRRATLPRRVVAALVGLVFGLGTALLAQQTGLLDAFGAIGFAVVIVPAVIAVAIPGSLQRPKAALADTPVRTPEVVEA